MTGTRPIEEGTPNLSMIHHAAIDEPELSLLEGHAAAYALDVLLDEEARAYETHLTRCAFCRDLVTRFQETADILSAVAAPAPANPALKHRLMSAVEEDLAAERAAVTALPPSQSRPALAIPTATPRATPWRWMRVPRWATGVMALLVIALGAANGALLQSASQARQEAAAYETALATAAGGRVIPLGTTGGASRQGRIALITSGAASSSSGAEARLVAVDLPPPGEDRTYQLWLIQGGTPREAGTFDGGKRVQTISVQGDPATAQVVAVTVEPRGGSRAPTTTPIYAAQL